MKLFALTVFICLCIFEAIGFFMYLPTHENWQVGSREWISCMIFGGMGITTLLVLGWVLATNYTVLTTMRTVVIASAFGYLCLGLFKPEDKTTVIISVSFTVLFSVLAFLYYLLEKLNTQIKAQGEIIENFPFKEKQS